MKELRGAILGRPVAHSASPLLYRIACEENGCTSNYQSIETSQNRFEERLARLQNGDFDWVNLTSPLKQEIFKQSNISLSEDAMRTQSANLLYLCEGKLCADNTDVAGFEIYFEEVNARPQSALIFGTGGAARSCAVAFERRSIPFVFASRKTTNASIIQVGSPEYFEAFERSDCIVQATSIALLSADEEEKFFAALFPKESAPKLAIELNYKRDTAFLRLSRSLQFQTFDGGDMLCEQAAVCFERMTNKKAPREKMREALLNSQRRLGLASKRV